MKVNNLTMYNQLDESTRTWGMACHLSALAGFAIPFGSIIAPLIIWITQKDKHPFIAQQGKESVNFQISMSVYILAFSLILLVLSIILALLSLLLINSSSNFISPFAILTLIAPFQIVFIFPIIFQVVIIIIAAVKAYNGQSYRYPFNLRFLK